MPKPPRHVLALSVLAALLWIPQAWILATTLAVVVVAVAGGGPVPSVGVATAGFLALAVLRSALDTGSVHAAQAHAARVRRDLRRSIAGRAAAWSPVDVTRPAAGEIAALAADQVEAIEPYLVRYAPTRARMAVLPLAIAGCVALVSWAAALILVLAGPFIPLLMSLIGAEARNRSRDQLAEIGTFTGTLLDRVSGLATIRLFRAEERVAAAIGATGEEIRRRTMAVLRLAFLSSAVLELFAALGVGLVAVYVGFSLLGWIGYGWTFQPLELSTGLFVLLLAPDFFQPLRDFAAAYHDKAAADAFLDRHKDLMESPRASILPERPGPAGTVPAAGIDVDGLTVRAPGTGAVMVEGITFSLRPGDRVALWGPSGSGKSTVLAALAGLIEPASGTVTAGGRDLSTGSVAEVRRSIAWLGQIPFLERRSLRRNLVEAGRTVADTDMAAALQAVDLAGLVERMPRGLGTRLGEEGAGVSGGEARRLALARALLADRPILLADEPTADLDADTAALVRSALLAVGDGRTLVVATHDPLLARSMDRIIRLADGRLVGEELT